MKPSQVRSASLLIEQLEAVKGDLETFLGGGPADASHVVVMMRGKSLRYRPLKSTYKDFLRSRKEMIEDLLAKLGVDTKE
jgi:hypothetical protein